MGIFGESKDAQTFEKSQYFTPGLFLVQLAKVKNVQGPKGHSFIVECTIVATRSQHEDAPQPGETAAHVIGKLHDPTRRAMGLSDIRQFMECLLKGLGKDPGALSPDQWDAFGNAAVAADWSAQPTLLVLECFMNVRQTFTCHRWKLAGVHVTPDVMAQFGITA